jgi:hypothetical protein
MRGNEKLAIILDDFDSQRPFSPYCDTVVIKEGYYDEPFIRFSREGSTGSY